MAMSREDALVFQKEKAPAIADYIESARAIADDFVEELGKFSMSCPNIIKNGRQKDSVNSLHYWVRYFDYFAKDKKNKLTFAGLGYDREKWNTQGTPQPSWYAVFYDKKNKQNVLDACIRNGYTSRYESL